MGEHSAPSEDQLEMYQRKIDKGLSPEAAAAAAGIPLAAAAERPAAAVETATVDAADPSPPAPEQAVVGEHSTPSKRPVKKVTAQAAGAAAVVVGVWVASLFGVDVPTTVAGAATILAGFGAGYLKSA